MSLEMSVGEENNLYIEQSVLGSILRDGLCWDLVADKVSGEHFTYPQHKAIFEAMRNLAIKNIPIDLITTHTEISTLKSWDNDDILAYLGNLRSSSSGSHNLSTYTDLLVKHGMIRQLSHAATKISLLASDVGKLEPSEMIDKAESIIYEIEQQNVRGGGPVDIQDSLKRFIDNLDNFNIKPLSTGYRDIDYLLDGGMRGGEMFIIAGRPGSGKTTLGMNIAEYVALSLKKRVMIFSLEMSEEALISRLYSSVGGIDLKRIREKKITTDDLPRLTYANQAITASKIKLDFTPNIKPSELRARARREKRKNPDLSLILVDYIQKMSADKLYQMTTDRIAEISGAIKDLSKELDIPIIALAQLNRNSVKTEKRRPTMADLRDSGAMEQDADVIALIYRDDDKEDLNVYPCGKIIIDKNRNGEVGDVELSFIGRYNKYTNKGDPNPSFN